MSTKTNPHATEEKLVVEPQEISSSIPKMIEPITAVPPTKPKKKASTKSTTKKKKPSKSKKGESKLAFTMNDLYVKEIPVGDASVKDDVDTSVQESKGADVQATSKVASIAPIFEFEKVTQMKP